MCSSDLLDAKSDERNCYDAWSLLSALAVDTKGVRLGTLVTCASYRCPSVLAKVAAGVDVMSGGRLEFGIGAGLKELEYTAYGIPFPSPGERVSRLEEAVQIVKAMWTQPNATFNGRYYHVRDAFCAPKPLQKPHPRVWIGGSKPRVMRVLARYGDGFNTAFRSVQQYREVLDILRRECQAVGRDFNSIQKSHFMSAIVGEQSQDVERLLAAAAKFAGRSVEEEKKARTERGFVGSPDGLADRLNEYQALGVSQFMLVFPYGHDAEHVRLVARKVLPQL